jgi:hypothetical protein
MLRCGYALDRRNAQTARFGVYLMPEEKHPGENAMTDAPAAIEICAAPAFHLILGFRFK